MSLVEIYEKMLKDPKNRVSTSGMIKQPMPTAAELHGVSSGKLDTSNLPEESHRKAAFEDVSNEDAEWISSIDKRMALRKEGKLPAGSPSALMNESRLDRLESRLTEIEGLLIEVMKAQMKILNG